MSTASVDQSLIDLDRRQAERWANDQNLLISDIELHKLVLDVVKEHIPGIDVSASVTDGEVIRDMTAASQVTVTVHDYERTLVNDPNLYNEGGFLRDIDINVDGLWFRLTAVDKQASDISLTFEDRDIAYLRDLKGPRKAASRAKVTRAEYILQLIRAVKERRIPVQINELKKVQPVAPPTGSDKIDALKTKKARDKSKQHGFPAKFKMKGVTQSMLDNMTVAMDEAEKIMESKKITGDMHDRLLLIMLVAGFGESGWDKSKVDWKFHTHKGVFQSDQIPPDQLRTQAHYFMIGGKSFKDGGAIKAARNETWTVGMCAASVEISDGSAAYYDSFFKQARKLLDAWGGGAPGATSRRKHYQFEVKKKETYWDAITRMAGEVNWRAFFVGGTFYYISEEDLFKSRARYRFSERDDGVINIDFSQDRRRKVMKATATVHINRWAIPPGVIVQIDDLGPASGKWLVQTVTRSLFSSEATLALSKPMPQKAEPFPGFTSSGSNTGAQNNDAIITDGALADRLYQAAQEISRHKYPYVWGGGHRKAGTPDHGTGGKEVGYDCSGGVAACLYYANALPADLLTNVPRSDNLAASLGWKQGVGDSVTIWANASHIFLEVKPSIGPNSNDVQLHRSNTVVPGQKRWIHLGTGRFGKSYSGFGVCGTLHPHGGFVPYSPRRDGFTLHRSHTFVPSS